MLTRRAAVVLLTAAALPRAGFAEDPPEAAARAEGTVTWYVAQVDSEGAEALGRRFTAAHPGITVAVIRTTGQVAYQRLLMELKNGAPQCDVLSTTDISQMLTLKQR